MLAAIWKITANVVMVIMFCPDSVVMESPDDVIICRRNLKRTDVTQLPAIPGAGWDNLNNRMMGPVLEERYTNCKLSQDENFLIPDSIETTPADDEPVQTAVELFEHWNNVTSAFSNTINRRRQFEADVDAISGTYSDEFKDLKLRLLRAKAIAARVQLRRRMFSATTRLNTPFSPGFSARLRKLALLLDLNKPRVAWFVAQGLVRDYGTHVITRVDVGTTNMATSFLPKSEAEIAGREKILRTLNRLVNTQLGLRAKRDYGVSNNLSQMELWEDMDNSPRAIDKHGIPLYELITSDMFPHLPKILVRRMSMLLRATIRQYYRTNIRRGCTDPEAPNFSPVANVDDGSCEAPTKTFPFGGVYQTCEDDGDDFKICGAHVAKNPVTDNFNCSAGFSPVLLDTMELKDSRNVSECKTCWLFFSCCEEKTEFAEATISAFWCAADPEDCELAETNHKFGGVFSTNSPNMLTGEMNCLEDFVPVILLEDLSICISSTPDVTDKYLPFAGFSTCVTKNPYLDGDEDENQINCPSWYSEQLAQSYFGCDIIYCIDAGKMDNTSASALRRPPFLSSTGLPKESYREPYRVDSSGIVQIWWSVQANSQWTFTKQGENDDSVPVSKETDSYALSADVTEDEDAYSAGTILLCWLTTTVLFLTIAWLVYKAITWKRKEYTKV